MRLLLKLSGEQLAGDDTRGFDIERARWIAGEIKPLLGRGEEIVIIVGGGNFMRGEYIKGSDVAPVTADNMGMLATLMNGVALADVFNAQGVSARVLTNVVCDQVADQFTYRRAESHLKKGRVVIISGGVGRPFFTTDTVSVAVAQELNCDLIAKATKVDGVYTADPAKDPNAKKIDNLTYDEAVNNNEIRVMDKAALGMAGDYKKPIVVFELLKSGNIASVVNGENVGTRIG